MGLIRIIPSKKYKLVKLFVWLFQQTNCMYGEWIKNTIVPKPLFNKNPKIKYNSLQLLKILSSWNINNHNKLKSINKKYNKQSIKNIFTSLIQAN